MKLTNFDYYLPPELIAQEPAPSRDLSRLMVVSRKAAKSQSKIQHKYFRDILDYLSPGDTLVINDSKVLPARLAGKREKTGAAIEVLLLKPLGEDNWECLARPGKKVRVGEKIIFNSTASAVVKDKTQAGGRVLEFNFEGSFEKVLDKIGVMPLPPYIKKQPRDPGRYQTVYAGSPGSVAAPTAGLHFTNELLALIREKGVNIVSVLLHVGLGTFRPVQAENIQEHHMHAEYYEITECAAETIEATRDNGGRIIAVGTTTTRCLESMACKEGKIRPGSGWTDIFIYPGYEFKVVDGLLTNFHLPKSTLLMLVSAFAGQEAILGAYQTAVDLRYRFFSFGDAMLII